MSVRAAPLNTAAADLGGAIAEVQPEAAALAEGNSFATQSSENPLRRNIVVSIRASLNDVRAFYESCHASRARSRSPAALPRPSAVPPEGQGPVVADAGGAQVDLPGEEVRHPRRRAGDARRPQGMFRSNSNHPPSQNTCKSASF